MSFSGLGHLRSLCRFIGGIFGPIMEHPSASWLPWDGFERWESPFLKDVLTDVVFL